MTKIVGVSGSLRRSSFNTALLRAAAGLMPEDAELTVATIHGIPLYDADLESSAGIPQPVTALKDLIAGSDGLLLATPEYNNSIPGVFKNAYFFKTFRISSIVGPRCVDPHPACYCADFELR